MVFFFCCLMFLCATVQHSYAQEPEKKQVKWVSSISSKESVKGNFSSRLLNTILGGKSYHTLGHPMSVWVLKNGELRILDQQSKTIWGYKMKKGKLFPAVRSRKVFPSLVGMCSLDGERIAFTDSYLGKVFLLSEKGKVSELVQGSIVLQQPTGIAWSTQDKQFWVVETTAHRISIFNENGELIKRIGERGKGPLLFNFPTFIWIDAAGLVYVVDSMNFRIQILNNDGSFNSAFGKIGDASGYFARPKGISTDSHGHIYIVDALFNTVQIFDRNGDFLYNFGSQGHEDGHFWLPTDIYVDRSDNIYVTDTYNSRIQVFKLIVNE